MARTFLTTPITFLLSTTGSDSNDGITAPWQTPTGAFNNLMSKYDLGGIPGHSLSVADGTYLSGVNWYASLTGQAGPLLIRGASGDASKVCVRPSVGNAFAASGGASLVLECMTFDTSLSNQDNITAGAGGLIQHNNVWFGGAGTEGYHMTASEGGTILMPGGSTTQPNGYAIKGSAAGHISVGTGSQIVYETNGQPGILSVTVSNTVSFSAGFWCANDNALIQALALTFNIAAGAYVAGPKYLVQNGGRISTAGTNPAVYLGFCTGAGVNPYGTGFYT